MENELDEALMEYKTPEARKQVLEFLVNMKVTPGWEFIVKFLEKNISDLTEAVVDPADGMSDVDINRLRDKIKIQKGLIKLPDNIILALRSGAIENNTDLEVYE